jgi:hypothetical protein
MAATWPTQPAVLLSSLIGLQEDGQSNSEAYFLAKK